MKEEVFDIISAVMEVPRDDLKEDSTKDTIANWDSVRQLNLVFALEDQFGVKFADEDILQMNGVADILAALNRTASGEMAAGN